MIGKKVCKFCKDDLSLIENYDKAINDNINVWECHHRLEIELNVSREYLKQQNLYFNRPASELIFMTKSDHNKIHKQGEKHPMYGLYGDDNPNYGKHRSEETKQKMSDHHYDVNGINNPMYNRHHSEESNEKNRLSHLGKHRVYRDDGSFYMSY